MRSLTEHQGFSRGGHFAAATLGLKGDNPLCELILTD